MSPPVKDTSPTGLGPCFMISFSINYLLKGFPNIVTLAVRVSTYDFCGTQFRPEQACWS